MSAASHVLLQVRSGWWKDGTVRHAAFMFVGNMSFNAASFLMFVILGRLITVRDYGELLSLLSIIMILSLPAGLLQPVITRVVAELIARGDRSAISRLARSLVLPFVLLALLVIAMSSVLSHTIAAYFHIERATTVVCAGIVLGTSMISPIQRAILQGGQRYYEYSVSQIIEAGAKLTVPPTIAVLGFGVSGALAGYVVAALSAVAFNAWILRSRFGSPSPSLVIPWHQLFIGARRTALVAFILTALSLYDVVIVKHVFDPEHAGIYSAAAVVGRAILTLVGFIPALILPKVSLAFARREATAHYLGAGLVATSIPIILALALVLSEPGIVLRTMAGTAFVIGAPLVAPLAISGALLAIAGTLSAYLTARKSFDFVAPLCVFAVLEIVTVAVWHPSLLAVAHVVTVGNAAVLLSMAIAAAPDIGKIAVAMLPRPAKV